MNKTVAGFIVVILSFFLFSCKTGKQPVRRQVKIIDSAKMKRYGLITVDTPGAKAVVTAKPQAPQPPSASTEQQKLIEVMDPVWKKVVNFSTFSGKAKCHYAGLGQKQEFTAHIRIQRDKVIWVNVTSFLINVARIYITPDSIQLVNHLQREAHKMHISQANKLLPAPVDFNTMQNLIVGNALSQSGSAVAAKDFGGTLSVQVEEREVIQLLAYNKTDSTLRSVQMRTRDARTEGMIQYGNYEIVTGRRFATSRAINLSNEGEPHYLDMNFNGAEFDGEVEMPFSIPKNYEMK
jgi:hypothetical protein